MWASKTAPRTTPLITLVYQHWSEQTLICANTVLWQAGMEAACQRKMYSDTLKQDGRPRPTVPDGCQLQRLCWKIHPTFAEGPQSGLNRHSKGVSDFDSECTTKSGLGKNIGSAACRRRERETSLPLPHHLEKFWESKGWNFCAVCLPAHDPPADQMAEMPGR